MAEPTPEQDYEWLQDHVKRTIRSLMLSDNMGDVHEAVDRLRSLVGLEHLEGNYLEGWTDEDWRGID